MKNAIKALLAALAVLSVTVGLALARAALSTLTGGASDWVILAFAFAAVAWVSYLAFREIDRELTGADEEWEPTARDRAISDVLQERRRQIDREGFTPERDADVWPGGELADAAACYAADAGGFVWQGGWPGEVWPWGQEWWKPSTPRRNLVKAGALILAEIERLDRVGGTK
jgi:hypothetical protein